MDVDTYLLNQSVTRKNNTINRIRAKDLRAMNPNPN
jgi:hypothetical protein